MREEEQLPLTWARTVRRWRKLLDMRLKELNVTQARWTTLLFLHKSGEGVTQRELASRMAIENPTLVRLLDNLESQGLIERKACEGDRRIRRIYFTPRGTEFMGVLYERSEDLRDELLEGVAEEDIETTLKVIKRISSNADRLL